MDNQIANKIEQFAQGLRWAQREDGDPSFRELRRRTGYSISTISRVLSGKCFPKWDFTRKFLHACHVPDEQISGRWRARWQELADLHHPLGESPYQAEDDDGNPEPASPAQAGTECVECGALITNPFRHQTWHKQYIRRSATRDRSPLTAAEVTDPSITLHRLSS